MINYNPLKTNVNFGARITYGTKGEPTPFKVYSYGYFLNPLPTDEKLISEENEKKMHKATLNHIQYLLNDNRVVHPSLEPNESNLLIKDQSIARGKSIDDKYQQDWNNMEKEVDIRFEKAGNILNQQFGPEISELSQKVMKTDPKSPEFVDRIIDMNKFFVRGYETDINVENNKLENIAKSKEATIFVVDHYSAPFDICATRAFMAELYNTYKKLDENGECPGLKKDCPRPKFILNKSILEGMPDELKDSFKKVGAAGIIAMPYPTKEGVQQNKDVMNEVVNGFIKDKNHILIFPEGRRILYNKEIPLEDRFQYGIGKIVQKALNDKDRVKIVSLGAFGDDSLGVLHIGNPLYFEKDGDKIKVSGGNITPDNKYAKKNSFYKKLSNLKEDEKLTICHKGEPIKTIENPESNEDKKNNKFTARLISGVLCADMDTCANIAIDKLNKEKNID